MSRRWTVSRGAIRALGTAAIASLFLTACLGTPLVAAAVPEPEGYRQDSYRSDVPETLQGARVVSTDKARALLNVSRTLFIDVMPLPPKPANLREGTVWRDLRRDSIPGSHWLPNVGYGRLHPTIDAYFRGQLERLTGGDRTRPLLFFCLARCWMSWNAAKRALEYGYGNVIWYPEGTDGWAEAGLGLERVEPEK